MTTIPKLLRALRSTLSLGDQLVAVNLQARLIEKEKP